MQVTFIEAYKSARKLHPWVRKEAIWFGLWNIDMEEYAKTGHPLIKDVVWIKGQDGPIPKKKKFVITVNEVFINNFYDIRDYHLLEYLNKTQPDCEWFGCVIKPKEEND